jgi:GntR family transcriptional regulator
MLAIDKLSRVPIYEQIIEGVQKEILLGLMKPGDQLPSIRELAVNISANPNTVQKAFIELERRGVMVTSPGRGCYVSDDAPEILKMRLKAKLADITELSAELAMGGVKEEEVIEAVKKAFYH